MIDCLSRPQSPHRTAATVTVSLLAVATVAAGYAASTRLPDDAATPLVILVHLYALMLLGGLLWLATGVGRGVLRLVGVASESRLEQLLLSVALGLGVVANVVLALGLVGLLRPIALAGAVAALAVLARRDLAALARGLPDLVRAGLAVRTSLRERGMAGRLMVPLTELMVGVVATRALAPPIGYDALMYHLHGPKRFLELGRLTLLPDVQQANMPITVDLLYLLGLAFGSAELANALHLAFSLLVAAATFSFGRDYLGERVGWIAAATFLSTTMISVYGPVANIDYGLALFDFLAVCAFARWLRTRQASWLVVAGLLIGFALGSKYLGALTPLALGLALVGDWLRRSRRPLDLLRVALAIGAPAALIAAPWYVKNLVWLGSPVWPFLAPGPKDLNIELMANAHLGRGLLDVLLLPLRLYTEGSLEHPDARPALLLLALPLYLVVPRNRVVSGLLAVATVHVVVWTLGAHVLRYLTPVLPELCIASAYVVATLARAPRFARVGEPALRAAVVGCMVITTTVTLAREILIQPFGQLVGLESREAYLTRLLPNHELVTYLNARPDAVRGVLLLGDRRGFYLAVPSWVDVSANQFRALATAPDADTARAILDRLGVSHVVVSEDDVAWHAQWDPEGTFRGWWHRFQATAPEYLVAEKVGRHQTLYRVVEATEANAGR